MKETAMFPHNESLTMKAFDFVVLAAIFVFNSTVLALDWQYIAMAIGGSLSGAVMLAYFRRDPRKGEQVFKTLCSAIGGIVTGTAIEEFLALDSPRYILALYFHTGLLSLVFLRALLSLTERSSADVIRDLLQRIFNLRLPNEQRRKRRRRSGDSVAPNSNEKEGE